MRTSLFGFLALVGFLALAPAAGPSLAQTKVPEEWLRDRAPDMAGVSCPTGWHLSKHGCAPDHGQDPCPAGWRKGWQNYYCLPENR